jgi:nitrogen-specific signal transduction histidine kinase
MKKKQTAVEWLIVELNSELNYIPITQWDRIRDLIQRAKAMEKEQIIDFAYSSIREVESELGDLIYKKVPEEIYTETYGGNK